MGVSGIHFDNLKLDACHSAHKSSWASQTDLFTQLLSVELPTPHDKAILSPFREYVGRMDEAKFTCLTTAKKEELDFAERKEKQSIQWIGDALLQRKFQVLSSDLSEATVALQAIASGFFDNLRHTKNQALLLLAVNRAAPLVMWGSSRSPISVPHSEHFQVMGVDCGILALPKHNAHAGISIWGGLTHENGHHIVDGIPGLMDDIKKQVNLALTTEKIDGVDEHFRKHFVASSKEIACDILALFDGGPAFVLSLLATLEAEREGKLSCRGAYFGDDKTIKKDLVLIEGKHKLAVSTSLSDVQLPGQSGVFGKRITPKKQRRASAAAASAGSVKGKEEEPIMRYRKFKYSDGHPVDISRLLVLSALLRKLAIAPELKREVDVAVNEAILKAMDPKGKIQLEYVDYDESDGESLVVKSHEYSLDTMKEAAAVIGDAIGHSKFTSLEDETLFDVFPWGKEDNRAVENLQEQLSGDKDLEIPSTVGTKALTSYILSAAILNSCQAGDQVEKAFSRMKKFLVQAANRSHHDGASA